MNEKDFMDIINKKREIRIQLEGIIETNLIIKNAKVFLQTDKIEIINQKEKGNYIAFNRHQLAKIESDKENIKFIFDQLQIASIKK